MSKIQIQELPTAILNKLVATASWHALNDVYKSLCHRAGKPVEQNTLRQQKHTAAVLTLGVLIKLGVAPITPPDETASGGKEVSINIDFGCNAALQFTQSSSGSIKMKATNSNLPT